jgi:hypothetical protein
MVKPADDHGRSFHINKYILGKENRSTAREKTLDVRTFAEESMIW